MFVYYLDGTSCFTSWAQERRKVNEDPGYAFGSQTMKLRVLHPKNTDGNINESSGIEPRFYK